MNRSKLVVYTKLSPNHSGERTESIDRITPHCVVGQCSIESLGGLFAQAERRASSNYGIGSDGRVGLFVPEEYRSWCSGSNANDQRAVTIECASDNFSPYAMTDAVYKSLVDLCVDICRRNGKKRLLWIADKDTALSYHPRSHEMVLTVHRWFENRSCPGEWLYSRLGELAHEVNAKLNENVGERGNDLYRVQVGAFKNRKNAEKHLTKIKNAGFNDAFIVTVKDYFK